MRTFLHLDGVQYCIDSRRTFTHVVMTALNKEPLVPKGRSMTPREINTSPDKAKIMDELSVFAHEEVAGRFVLKPADWATSENEAKQMAAFYADEKLSDGVTNKWSEVQILPVSGSLDHA